MTKPVPKELQARLNAPIFASRQEWRDRVTWRSDSPMYMLMSSGPLTARKLSAHSVATAFARRVLPVPAGRGAPGFTNTDLNTDLNTDAYSGCWPLDPRAGAPALEQLLSACQTHKGYAQRYCVRCHSMRSQGHDWGQVVPGGPYSSTPDRWRRPAANRLGCRSGISTVSSMARFTSSSPPTSSHLHEHSTFARHHRRAMHASH